jgi:phospholipase C
MTRLRTRRGLAAPLTLAMTAGLALAGVMAGISTTRVGSSASATDVPTATPIKHVVVIIGENHTFDNVFATYQPPADQHVLNLLSEGMVTPSGTPGPEMGKALHREASDTKTYQIDPRHTGTYRTLPQPNTTYVSQACDGQAQNAPDTRVPTTSTRRMGTARVGRPTAAATPTAPTIRHRASRESLTT